MDLTSGAQSPTIRSMHHDPWEPPDGPYPAKRVPDPESSDADSPNEGEITRIPPPLLNWHVVEIEGEATLIEETLIDETLIKEVEIKDEWSGKAKHTAVDEATEDASLQGVVARPSALIREQYDEIVAAGMQIRRMVVMPGEVATFEVSIGNQGRWSALFEISIEGWIDEAWTPDLPLRVQMEPGTRQVVKLTLALPRHADCHAGEYTLAVVVRANRYPGHITRLAATLVVERYAALKVGVPQPRQVHTSWFDPVATLRLPITNQGNYAATIYLHGIDRERQCDFSFYANGSTGANGYDGDIGLDSGIPGALQLTVEPGQTVLVPVEVRTRQRSMVGLLPRITPFRLVARVDTEPPLRRAVDGQLACAPLIGPWHMAIAAVLGIVAIIGTGLAGLALLVALRSTPPIVPVAPAAATPIPAAPVVALVIQMDQPMPTRLPDAGVASGPVVALPPGESTAASEPSVPVVSADQVTAPGEPTPVGQLSLRPVVVTTPPSAPAQTSPAQTSNVNLTYGQMFQEVALRYDLDWRVLAAQAYLESGFDSLALSGQGDMGLMQIRPGTWNEFAPTVDASDPFDSYSNVLVGAVYLNYLREQLSEQGASEQGWMLVAYNWGPEKVFSHLAEGGTWESLDPERRQYADDILQIAASIPAS
jgi:membrane-bound lytic murein transglycosylase F